MKRARNIISNLSSVGVLPPNKKSGTPELGNVRATIGKKRILRSPTGSDFGGHPLGPGHAQARDANGEGEMGRLIMRLPLGIATVLVIIVLEPLELVAIPFSFPPGP
jgi:hypothetical protein